MQQQRGPNETTIVRLRVKSAKLDPLAARLRLERILNEARVHPRGLPASAIVFVKSLRDPLPGTLNLSQGAGASPAIWEEALSRSLDELVRGAARPALGHVPANTECVLFLDRPELLAALAADWCDGSALTRWWWRSLFRATDVTSAVVSEWLTSIEYVPAAFAKLAQKELAITFAVALPASAVSKLLDGITRHFGLSELRDALLPSRNQTRPPARNSFDPAELPQSKPAEMLSSSEAFQLRTRWAPEAFSPRLEGNARELLAVALMLERAPSLLREHGFASRLLRSLLNAAEQPRWNTGKAADRLVAVNESRLRPFPTSPKMEGENVESPATPERHRYDARVQRDSLNAPLEELHEPEQAQLLTRDLRAASARADGRSVSPSVESSLMKVEHQRPGVQATTLPETQVTTTTIEVAVETKLGGIFYVINAALALNLYGDFTMPLEPGIAFSIWDFLALTGRAIAGKQIEFDPIWPMLAKLAGREEGEQPGARFTPPGEWRMPPDWLNAFPERDEWTYDTSRSRLIVRHPAGFDVMDVKLGLRFRVKDIEARLARETRCYTNVTAFKRRRFVSGEFILRKREPGLDRWTRWIADYLRVRLSRALGIGPTDELKTMLFARAARVEVTPARLDVFFSLAELPIEIRLAGLDRDPGWVPAAGRAIAFHFD